MYLGIGVFELKNRIRLYEPQHSLRRKVIREMEVSKKTLQESVDAIEENESAEEADD